MSFSFYDAFVPAYLQSLRSVENILQLGSDHYQGQNANVNEVVESSIYEDMLPFRFQVICVVHHSLNAIKGIRQGEFGIPVLDSKEDYAGLQALVANATKEVETFSPEDINPLLGKSLVFKAPGLELPFLAEDFILSFSLPQFYFHKTTAYNILRMKGVPVGKRDYLGQMRIAGA